MILGLIIETNNGIIEPILSMKCIRVKFGENPFEHDLIKLNGWVCLYVDEMRLDWINFNKLWLDQNLPHHKAWPNVYVTLGSWKTLFWWSLDELKWMKSQFVIRSDWKTKSDYKPYLGRELYGMYGIDFDSKILDINWTIRYIINWLNCILEILI